MEGDGEEGEGGVKRNGKGLEEEVKGSGGIKIERWEERN